MMHAVVVPRKVGAAAARARVVDAVTGTAAAAYIIHLVAIFYNVGATTARACMIDAIQRSVAYARYAFKNVVAHGAKR